MAIASPILNNRTTTVKTQSTSAAASGIKNIQETLIKQGKVRKEILDRKKQIRDQRKEREKRRLYEDQLEASNIVIKPSGPVQMIQRSTKGFLERLIGFLGYLTAGWLLNNLPTWIAMGKEFIGRVQRMGQLITGFLDNITNIFTGFGKLLSAAFQNLIQFDLFDTSNRVKNAFSQLTTSIDGMGAELEEAIRLITTPLTEGMVTGEDAPPLGTEQTNEGAYESGEPLQGDSGGRALSGDAVDKKVLDFIADGEASQSDPYGGFNTSRGKTQGRATDKTIGWLAQNAQGAIGRYQHMPRYILDRAIAAGYNANTKFTPEVQDKITLHFLKTSHSYDSWKSGKLSDEDFLAKLSPTWRAIPQGPKNAARLGGSPNSTYNDRYAGGNASKGTWEQRLSKLKSIKSGATQQPSAQSQSPQQSSAQAPSQSTLPPLPPTDTLSGGVQRYGASRDKGARKHAGVDFDISGPNAKFYSRIGGVVVGSPFRFGADGWAIDIYNKELKVYERIAEAAKIVVKPGQTIKPGDLVAVGESGTGVIHYEIRKKIEGGFENSLDPIAFLKSLPTSASPTPAQSQPEPQIGSVNSEGKIYVDSKYGYQSRATVIAKGLLPSQDIKPQTSTPQQNLVNPPGALAPGQRPDRALTSEQLKIAQQTREQGKASGLTGEALEKSVAAAVMASSSTTQQTPAQISQSPTQAQQNQQLLQQITPDRRGQTIVVQQPSSPGSQGTSYSPSGGSRMMPISIDEITLLNNFMKNKLLLDLAYL